MAFAAAAPAFGRRRLEKPKCRTNAGFRKDRLIFARVGRIIIVLHLAFWLLFFGYKFWDFLPGLGAVRAFQLVGIPGLFNVLVAYAHYFFLLPLFLQRRYWRYTICLIALFALAIPFRGSLEAEYLGGLFGSDFYTEWSAGRVLGMAWNMATFLLFIALLKFATDRFELANRQKALENEKLMAELNYLKAQINPHFLFNTLHNLNYLVEQQSSQATEVIVKLSYIMRYMIYEASSPTVKLAQEVGYIRDYLALEEIRLNQGFVLEFSAEAADLGVSVAPLLIIPLVENAFKHGISDQQEDNWISIRLTGGREQLRVEISNSLAPTTELRPPSHGMGLPNLRQRLALGYPGRHELSLSRSEDAFSATLTLQLL